MKLHCIEKYHIAYNKMFMVENFIDIFNFTYGNLYVCVAFVVKL